MVKTSFTLRWKKGYGFEAKFLVIRNPEGGHTTHTMIGGNFFSHGDIPGVTVGMQVVGAGEVSYHGHVQGWHSTGFDVTTPEELREPLQAFFNENVQTIRDNWPRR